MASSKGTGVRPGAGGTSTGNGGSRAGGCVVSGVASWVLSDANNVGKCDFACKDDDVNSRVCKEDRKRDRGRCGDDVLKRGERHSSFFLSSSCSSLALQRLLAAYLVLLADSEDNNGGNSAKGECEGVEDDGDGCWGCCGKHVMS
jgi:hypothetical protein